MANINKIRLSGQTYDIQDSNAQPLLSAGTGIDITDNVISATGGGGTVDSAITSASTDAVESKAIYNATHVEQVDLWTPTDSSSYRDTSQSLYKVYVQYTGDTALDEQVQVEIYYGSSNTREAITGNVYQETASTSSVFTSTFDNGKWIIESLSPNYIVNIYSDYRFRIWTYDRTVGGDFAADVIKDDIIPYIGDVETVANNAIVSGSFVQGDNNREIAIRLQRGNGGSVTSSLRLDDLKYAQNVLSTDIQFPTGEVGWSEIAPQNSCTAGNMPTNKVKVTYSGQTVSAQYRTIRFDAIFRITSTYQQQYRTWINWTDTTTPTVDGCSAVTATYDSTDDSVTIELPTGETTYDGLTGTFSISNFRSNGCQFGRGISSVKYYGDITEDIYTAIAHKQDTLSAGTGISISGNVISATGGGGGTVDQTIISGSTNAVAGGAVYDKFDEVEQVTARALNDLEERKLDASAYTPTDLSQYWTSAQTNSAITQAVSGKANSSDVYLKTETSGATQISTALNGKQNATVELTQAEYDDLAVKDPNTFYVISDATAFDPTTKVDTSAITSSVTSASTDNEIPTAKAVYDAIPTGGTGGGKAIEAGRGISVTTGETADTVSCTLKLANGGGTDSVVGNTNRTEGNYSFVFGHNNNCGRVSLGSSIFGENNSIGYGCSFTSVVGYSNSASTAQGGHIEGLFNAITNDLECTSGKYNVSNKTSTTFGDSGNTLFSVGNGTADNARHNAFEIRQNGDIYFNDGTNDVKLQDKFSTIETTIGDINTILNSI